MTAPPQGRFLDLFAEEAEVRLRRLSEHFLALESGVSAEIVGAILRDAHSLKGAAAVIGLTGVSTVAHRLEDVMEPELTNPNCAMMFNDVNTWSEWLEMEERPGNFVGRAFGRKVYAYGELPAAWRRIFEDKYPDIAKDPRAALGV